MKLASRILKIVSCALAITVFGLMFYSSIVETTSQKVGLNYAQVFFGASITEVGPLSIGFNAAIGGFIGFLFVLIGGLITLLSAQKITKKKRNKLAIINAIGIVFSLVGTLLIFLIPNMFLAANPDFSLALRLSTVTLVTGFIGILEAILAAVAVGIDFTVKI